MLWPASGLAGGGGKQLERIRERMEQGLALFVAGKAGDAVKEFESGYAEYPYSAFLFNAGVCYEKLGKGPEALAKYRQYLQVDPNAPDKQDVERRIARLEAEGAPVAGAPPPPPPPTEDIDQQSMRSLVVIETEPAGAPVRVFRPKSESAPAYSRTLPNPDWEEIVTTTAPTSLSLSVGLYHIVIDKFKDFNGSDTQLHVSPGHVHQFKANLSQGVFMAFLRVSSNVRGAHLWLDTNDTHKPEWGTAPYGELVPVGDHSIVVQAPGFEPTSSKVTLESGEHRELQTTLVRVGYGFIRVDAGDAPRATVTLDGKLQGEWSQGGPALEVRASAGSHRLLVESDGRKDFEGSVQVPKGQILPVHLRMIPKYPRGAAWTQAIISAALLGTGAVLGSQSNEIKKILDDERAQGSLTASDPRITKGRWFAIGADVGFAGGAVLAGFATWNFIKDPLPESSKTEDPAVEFDDPLKRRPVALRPSSPPTQSKPVQMAEDEGTPWQFGAAARSDYLGISVGGQF
ncbi:MAG TPA: PEGA domain-containing protein [Polyangiaceae bacterium]|nr:PEGA domain-containing protein [Polyangiaceae bacterium]